MNTRRKRRLFSTAGAKVTSTVSVALVLFVLGLLSVVAIVTRKVADTVRESVGFDIVIADGATLTDIEHLKSDIVSSPFALSLVEHTAEESAKRWKEETGEDVVEVLGLNPFTMELEVKVRAPWASADSLAGIVSQFNSRPCIEEITVHNDVIDAVNANIVTVYKILGSIAIALLIISFVLINNTIRLSIYARRFTIHTMKLVGSTGAFIRRPFLISSMWQGFAAGLVATVMLCCLLSGMTKVEVQIEGLVTVTEIATVAGLMIISGIIICVIAALMSTNRYLRLSYDEMFR